MCRSFEVISGKKNKGNKSLLEGLTKMYRDAGYKTAIVSVPVEIMEIDTRYQTEEKTERDLRYLIDNWSENKLLPLIGVPHWESGEVYLVDGYGRWVASQIVDKEKYKYLDVLLILNAPVDKEKRLEIEAEMYAFQNKQVANILINMSLDVDYADYLEHYSESIENLAESIDSLLIQCPELYTALEMIALKNTEWRDWAVKR